MNSPYPFLLVLHENFFERYDLLGLFVSSFEHFTERPLPNFSHFLVFVDIITIRELQFVHELLSITGIHWSQISCHFEAVFRLAARHKIIYINLAWINVFLLWYVLL